VSQDEILAILKFGVVALIVLPLLPDRGLGPYQAVNPRDIGYMVVLLTAVSLIGYLLVRFFGEGKGYALAGLLGGLASSTAVALSFSRKARETPDLARPLAAGIVVASTVLYARGILVLLVLDAPLGRHLLPRLGGLLVVGLALSFVLLRRGSASQEPRPALSLGNPVELGHAVLLAALFGVVLLIARVAQAELGTAGLWTVGAVGGLVDVDSVAVAAARVRQQGVVEVPAAAGAYLLATLSNLIFKGGVSLVAGGRPLARHVWPAFAVLAVLTIAAPLRPDPGPLLAGLDPRDQRVAFGSPEGLGRSWGRGPALPSRCARRGPGAAGRAGEAGRRRPGAHRRSPRAACRSGGAPSA
jgi:uncharacterized membrane protein (DUF4010 family)